MYNSDETEERTLKGTLNVEEYTRHLSDDWNVRVTS